MVKIIETWRNWIKTLEKDTYTVYLISRHFKTPLYIKLLSLLVVGYFLSPIDLIPDFIPVLGSLDDLIIVPLGVALIIKLTPDEILVECRKKSQNTFDSGTRVTYIIEILIIGIWSIIGISILLAILNLLHH